MPSGTHPNFTTIGGNTMAGRRRRLCLGLIFCVGSLCFGDLARAQSRRAAPAVAERAEQPATDALTAAEKRKTDELIKEYSVQIGEPKTLTQLFAFAEENAPHVQRAREHIGLGEAAIEGAEKIQQFNPELEGELGVGLGDVGLAKAEVTLEQRLEIFGERGLRIQAARRRKQALRSEVTRAGWDVHQQVHRLYRLGLVHQERVGIEREILEFTQQLFQIAQERYEAGEEPRTSVIVAKAEIAQARQGLVQAWLNYIRALRDLGATVGWQAEKPPQPSGDVGQARPIPAKAELVDKALEEDPQLAVLEARLEQARTERTLEERKIWPNPLFGIGWEGESFNGAEAENKLRFVIAVPLPLWDQNQGEVAAAQARTQIFRQAIENRKRILENLVSKQAETVQAAYKQAQIYEEEVLPALETQLELLQDGFELGEMSLLDVMNARDRLLAVQRQYLGALQEYFIAVSELENLLGTAIWETEEG